MTVKGVCGIKFGTSYNAAKLHLENKFGLCSKARKNQNLLFKYKKFAGINFDYIMFTFQSDGTNTYLNGCVFAVSVNSVKQAEEIRDMLYEKLKEKYTMRQLNDRAGYKMYIGGYSPTGNGAGFQIDIVDFTKVKSTIGAHYMARLLYGPFNYVNEE